jgi:hypothetical protein
VAITPPDPVAALVAWLSDRPELTDIAVGAAPPENLGAGVDRAITVQPVSSPADGPAWNGAVVLFRPLLDIDAYAPSSTAAYDLANTVLGLLPDARGHGGEYGRIGAVTVPSTPDFRPNFTDVIFRWGGTCGLTMRAALGT